jgi:hypothetical protein
MELEMPRHRQLIAVAAILLAACASTTVRDSWYDPDYQGPAFRKVLVLGVFPSVSERRLFEDIMVAKINATGAEGIPGYRFLPGEERATEVELDRAVHESGADALLMARLRRVDTRTQVWTPMWPPGPGPWGWGWGGWYPGWWGGWYPLTVNQYNIATVESTLFSAPSRRVVWTGVTETFEPRSVVRDAPEFSAAVITALQSRSLLPVTK